MTGVVLSRQTGLDFVSPPADEGNGSSDYAAAKVLPVHGKRKAS